MAFWNSIDEFDICDPYREGAYVLKKQLLATTLPGQYEHMIQLKAGNVVFVVGKPYTHELLGCLAVSVVTGVGINSFTLNDLKYFLSDLHTKR